MCDTLLASLDTDDLYDDIEAGEVLETCPNILNTKTKDLAMNAKSSTSTSIRYHIPKSKSPTTIISPDLNDIKEVDAQHTRTLRIQHNTQPNVQPITKRKRSEIQCHFFAKGGCRNGSNCPFSHALQNKNERVQHSVRDPKYDTLLDKETGSDSYQKWLEWFDQLTTEGAERAKARRKQERQVQQQCQERHERHEQEHPKQAEQWKEQPKQPEQLQGQWQEQWQGQLQEPQEHRPQWQEQQEHRPQWQEHQEHRPQWQEHQQEQDYEKQLHEIDQYGSNKSGSYEEYCDRHYLEQWVKREHQQLECQEDALFAEQERIGQQLRLLAEQHAALQNYSKNQDDRITGKYYGHQ